MKALTFCIFLSFFALSFADVEEISEKEEILETEQRVEIIPEISKEESVSLIVEREKGRDHRYTVVSAVMMMVFLGFCMASVSAINPE